MPDTALPRLSLLILAAAVSTGTAGCRKGNPGRVEAEAISECEQGVRKATQTQSLPEASKIYYQSCAAVHAEPKCQQAWKKAATAPQAEQMKIVIEGCAEAYCSDLGGDKYEACRDDFKVTPSSIQRAWPALQGAILAKDTGPYQARVQSALLTFYMHATKLAAGSLPTLPSAPAPSASVSPPSGDAQVAADAKATAPNPSAQPKAAPTAAPTAAKTTSAKKPAPKPAQTSKKPVTATKPAAPAASATKP